MAVIYSINIGANSSHSQIARSPVFPDGRFAYVSFPTQSTEGSSAYPASAEPFVRSPNNWRTHADPDWTNLTYGDYCANPRAVALKGVSSGDILLFWGLLWANDGRDWDGFNGSRDWYLFGSLRVSYVVQGGQDLSPLSAGDKRRALKNAHFEGRACLPEGHYVFLGDLKYSRQFDRAVPLGTRQSDGLLYRCFTTAAGELLVRNGSPAWKSSLRSCRPVWRSNDKQSWKRAQLLAKEIERHTDFNILAGI